MTETKRRRRSVVLGVPAIAVALLAFVALWYVGSPVRREPGAAGTIGVDADRRASLDRVEVRQLTSDRTFWAGARDEDPVFVVAAAPIAFAPGTELSITGRIEAAPAVDAAQRAWGVNAATARAVHDRGVYVRASDIRRSGER